MKNKYTVKCVRIEVRPDGQLVTLTSVLPEPHPAADGRGNPITHPRPESMTCQVFHTEPGWGEAWHARYSAEVAVRKASAQRQATDEQMAELRKEESRARAAHEAYKPKGFIYEEGALYVVEIGGAS